MTIPQTMNAVAVTEPGKVEVVDIPTPTIVADYECLVRNLACGFCNSTDLKIIHGDLSDMTVEFPLILGHEGMGEVIEVGSKVKNLKVGDRILNPSGRLEPGTPFKSMWSNMKEYSIAQDLDVMRELGVDKAKQCFWSLHRVPADIDPIVGGLILTLNECCSGVRNFGVGPGTELLIYGDGPVGLGLATFARMLGASWVGVVGHHDDRLAHIAEFGGVDQTINSHETDVAEAVNRKLDLVIDAVGSTAIILESARLLKSGGMVGIYGVLKKKYSSISLLDLPNHVRLHMLNFPYGAGEVHDEVVAMIRDDKLDPKPFYSHVLPLTEAEKAVELIENREAFKVIFKV